MELGLAVKLSQDQSYWSSLARKLFRIQPDMIELIDANTNEEITELANLQDDPNDDDQIELRIYILFILFNKTRSVRDLEQAALYSEGWWRLTPMHHKDRPRRKQIFAALSARFLIPIDPSELLEYVDILSRSAKLTGFQFEKLYQTNGGQPVVHNFSDLIQLFQTAAVLTPVSNPHCARIFYFLGGYHGVRYRDGRGYRVDLTKSVEAFQTSLDLAKEGYPGRKWIAAGLRGNLVLQSQQSKSTKEIDQAIQLCDPQILQKETRNINKLDLTHAVDLLWLNALYATRHGYSNDVRDLERFNDLSKDMVTKGPLKDRMTALATAAQADTNHQADSLGQDGKTTSPILASMPSLLAVDDVKGKVLNDVRFEDLGLGDSSVEPRYITSTEEVSLEGEAKALALLNNYTILHRRYCQTGALEDICGVISMAEKCLELTRLDNPLRPLRAFFLADALQLKMGQTKSFEDFPKLERLAKDTLRLIGEGDLLHVQAVTLVAKVHSMRYKMTGNPEDLDKAIELMESNMSYALSHPNEAFGAQLNADLGIPANEFIVGSTMKLHDLIMFRYQRTGDISDLEKCLQLADSLVKFLPSQRLNVQSIAWSYHGEALMRLYEKTGVELHVVHATQYLQRAWYCPQTPNQTRFLAGLNLANCLVAREELESAAKILEDVVRSVTTLSPRSLQTMSKQTIQYHSVGNIAATISLRAKRTPYDALKVLELGRGIVTSAMLDMRVDVSVLQSSHPRLASEFLSAAQALDPAGGSASASPEALMIPIEEGGMRRQTEEKLNKILDEIRTHEGFEYFLAPLTEKALMEEARFGAIVVVNSSPYGCDAFIVEKDRIQTIKLPNVSVSEIEEKSKMIRGNEESDIWDALEWMWDAISRPILEALGITGEPADDSCDWPHIWWIPTGPLTKLPLHAAGRHLDDSGETVLDRVISSYNLSVRTISHGRQKRISIESPHAVLIPMENTPGEIKLPFAKREIDDIEALCGKLKLKPLRPLQQSQVLSSLNSCRIFHFAGHGNLNPTDPSKSSLLLKDWKTSPLTVDKVWNQNLQAKPPFLAYLSACSTGANDRNRYSDEGLNLINAFQLAGFRHVIGTLWEVNDEYCVTVANAFYNEIINRGFKDEAVSAGLHRALRALRKESVEDSNLITRTGGRRSAGVRNRNAKILSKSGYKPSFHWLPYIHFGV
ncbi:hypothetical protein AA313_de0206981 [Arthrobotrys entomopaga]|nr:hypothetical protein AA313_de0206981 [Arthrobotrys entomopaga]